MQGMSAFSHRLRTVIDRGYNGSQTAFADACGITLSTISRLTREVTQPQPDTLTQFAERLPREEAATLCAAWLTDLLPPQLTYLVRIAAGAPDAPSMIEDTAARPDTWSQLDHQTRSALDTLADLAVRSVEAREAIISAAAYVRGDSMLTPTAAAAVSIARADASRRAKPQGKR